MDSRRTDGQTDEWTDGCGRMGQFIFLHLCFSVLNSVFVFKKSQLYFQRNQYWCVYFVKLVSFNRVNIVSGSPLKQDTMDEGLEEECSAAAGNKTRQVSRSAALSSEHTTK